MISINPDIIDRYPDGCHVCPIAFYDEHNGAVFFCGLSRFSVNKQRKQKTRHSGCGLIDTDYGNEEPDKPQDDPKPPKEETVQDVVNGIVTRAKGLASTLREGDVGDEDFETDLPETTDDNLDLGEGDIENGDEDGEEDNGSEEETD